MKGKEKRGDEREMRQDERRSEKGKTIMRGKEGGRRKGNKIRRKEGEAKERSIKEEM